MKHRAGSSVIRIFLALFFVLVHPAQAQDNLIGNPSFEEESEDGTVASWIRAGFSAEGGVTVFELDADNPHTGNRAAKIINRSENHAYYTQEVKVEESSVYKLSAWIRTEKVDEKNSGAGLGVIDKLDLAGDIRGTRNWTYAELFVKIEKGIAKEITSVTIMLGLGNYGSENEGVAWFDEVSFVKVNQIPPNAAVSIVDFQPRIMDSEFIPPVYPLFPPVFPPDSLDKLLFLLLIAGILLVISGAIYFILLRQLKK